MTPPSEPLKIGIAGLGKMGLLHAAVFNSLPGCKVVAAADPAGTLRNTLSAINKNIEMFEDANTMINTAKLDGVIIATPVADHMPMALACVKRKIPFFLEKPLAVSAAQASDLVAALQATPIPHMIGYMTRFIDTFVKGRDILNTGALGQIQRVSASIYVSQLFGKGKGWRYDKKISGGGVILAQGSHLIDLLTWYFGPVKRVNAQTLSVYSAEIEDFGHLMLEFQSGVQGIVDCSWSVRFRRTVETSIDILGDHGSLQVSDDVVRLFLDKPHGALPEGWSTWTAPELYRGAEIDIGGPQYTREDEAFIAGLRGEISPQPDIMQALHIQRIVDGAYASSQNGGAPVMVNL